jgi:hypothetical protein
MKKLFLFLLKKYSRNEKQRFDIIETLNEQVRNNYTEQTGFENVYNTNIEFIIGNKLIRNLIYENRTDDLDIIKRGLILSTDEAIKYIKNEPRRLKIKKLNEKG